MSGPSRHALALAATLLVLFAVNAVADNMCKDHAQMTSDDSTCTQVNKEIEDKLPIDPSAGGGSGGGGSGGGGSGGGSNGEQMCEGHGYDEATCKSIGCCQYDNGNCWSDVGTGPCTGRRSGSGGTGFGDKFERVTCEDLCGSKGAAALQLMHANPSCCGGSKDRLLCHNSDGECDPAATRGGDDNLGVVIAIFMSVAIVALMACIVVCGRRNQKTPQSPEGAGDYIGSLSFTGTIPFLCINNACSADNEYGHPPYSFKPAGDWCYNKDPKGAQWEAARPELEPILLQEVDAAVAGAGKPSWACTGLWFCPQIGLFSAKQQLIDKGWLAKVNTVLGRHGLVADLEFQRHSGGSQGGSSESIRMHIFAARQQAPGAPTSMLPPPTYNTPGPNSMFRPPV